MTPSQTISYNHQLLSNIALKMLGTWADAEDIVQDTYLKWLTVDQSKIKNTKAYLVKAVTNNCINHLNSLKTKKEEYLENFNLSGMIDMHIDLDLNKIDLGREIAAALNVLHKKLEPLEKAVFILREVFDFEYEEIHVLFDKKKDNCRQIFCRAKEKLSRKTTALKPEINLPTNFLSNFKDACALGVSADFLNILKKELNMSS
ncbi:MAG: sigma-70 family RNA polymerase sigma factor [Cyclobacteriaceae bacterium]|nr:sigma-70 family RNA polymerase sigma factor [Cyclobacteriaceae bacterium]